MSDQIVIIIFKIKGCPACAEYIPRFRRMAIPYRGRFPMHVVDAESNEHTNLADQFNVQEVPVTLVLRYPNGIMRYEGALDNNEIKNMLALANRYA